MIATNSKGKSTVIPAVAYVRCSSDQQIDASIPAQRSSIEKYASEHGYRIARWYVDEGISGWKDTRDGFQQLIADLPRGDFQAVLCWDQNRFSRFPVLEANHYWFLLDKSGVHLATCNQGRVDLSCLLWNWNFLVLSWHTRQPEDSNVTKSQKFQSRTKG